MSADLGLPPQARPQRQSHAAVRSITLHRGTLFDTDNNRLRQAKPRRKARERPKLAKVPESAYDEWVATLESCSYAMLQQIRIPRRTGGLSNACR